MRALEAAVEKKLVFWVPGVPVTQGSVTAFVPRGGTRPVIVHKHSRELAGWRDAVASAADRAIREWEEKSGEKWPARAPVSVGLDFRLPVPKSRPKVLRTAKQVAEWQWPSKRPDLDKLIRACLDALTGIVISDDCQVCRLVSSKSYSDRPGVFCDILVLLP